MSERIIISATDFAQELIEAFSITGFGAHHDPYWDYYRDECYECTECEQYRKKGKCDWHKVPEERLPNNVWRLVGKVVRELTSSQIGVLIFSAQPNNAGIWVHKGRWVSSNLDYKSMMYDIAETVLIGEFRELLPDEAPFDLTTTAPDNKLVTVG